MTLRRCFAVAFVMLALFACKTGSRSKNDDIAACNASGGHWEEGGCNDSGRCEKSTGNGMAPADDDDFNAEPDDEPQDRAPFDSTSP